MKSPNLKLKNSVTSELLYYSWINLKNNNEGLFESKASSFLEPLSKYWFDKASSLIRNGTYRYTINNILKTGSLAYSYKKTFLGKLKNKIIENAFLLLLKPYFSFGSNLENINLTECLRLLLNNLFQTS